MFHRVRNSPVIFVMAVTFPWRLNRVKHEAFLPHKNSEDLSVFRISGLSENQVWVIGREYVQQGGRPIKARADLPGE